MNNFKKNILLFFVFLSFNLQNIYSMESEQINSKQQEEQISRYEIIKNELVQILIEIYSIEYSWAKIKSRKNYKAFQRHRELTCESCEKIRQDLIKIRDILQGQLPEKEVSKIIWDTAFNFACQYLNR
ncbi:hypothetical protein K9L05_00530 [Candidatus Babeliales bacterium]|nr:hypothetical protein [Candidatus Babeliales bacterium]MCF7899119.1 hypothetical protein [Candidatus Babeliales bacterium]